MGEGVGWMVEFWGQQAIGCRMKVVAVSERVVNEFNGLIHRPTRAQGLVGFPGCQGICSPYSYQSTISQRLAQTPGWQLGADPAAATTQTSGVITAPKFAKIKANAS